MRTSRGVNKLPHDPHLATCLANAAFEDVSHSQFSPNELHVHGAAFVCKAGVPGDNEEPAHSGQRGDDLFDHAISEVFLLAVAAQVIEWEDGDGRLVR